MIEDIEELIKKSEKVLPSEDLFIEALRDVMKDEIKEYLKEKLKKNPRLKNEIRDAILTYLEAKIKESEAITKLLKSYAELGIITLPPSLREDLFKSIYVTFKKEIDEIIEKTL